MHRLHVLRHAKSSWKETTLPDHERPLAPRGRRALERIARYVEREGIRPAFVLCSTAVRARTTLEPLREPLGDPPVEHDARLYGASIGALVRRLGLLAEELDSVLLVGHNPGLQELVVWLAQPSPLRERAQAKLPAGALATLELSAAWGALGPGAGRLTRLVAPRELG